MLKVIFDRSIFHQGLEKLTQSNIKPCIDTGKVQLCFTVAFWEETLRLARKDKWKLKEQLDFLFLLDRGFWFRDIRNIIDSECKPKRLFLACEDFFFTKMEIEEKWRLFRDIADGSVDIGPAVKQYDDHIFPNMRQRVEDIQSFRDDVRQKKYKNFNDFYKNERTRFLGYLCRSHNSEIDLKECHWTEAYLRAFMVCYFPLLTSKIANDRNNRMDAEQLTYLTYADVMVSDDKKFMTEAFGVLFGNASRKQIFSTDQFLSEINKL